MTVVIIACFRVYSHDPYVPQRNDNEVSRLKAEVAALKKENLTLKTKARQWYSQGSGRGSSGQQGNFGRGGGRGARGGRGAAAAAPTTP